MKISPNWLREFVPLRVDYHRLAEDLTHAGIAVEGSSGEGAAMIFEMEITTNRVDAMNHHGVARECSAIYDLDLKPIAPKLPHVDHAEPFPIEILDPDLCARYTARVIRGVHIVNSPEHIAERLLIEDHRGINNVADATNYTLMEMGHPTHAFDLDLLQGSKIVVRRARSGEKLKTLDGIERQLHPEDLVIADAVKPVGLAGVMGGWDSMITAKTRNVLIESAWFDPATVRRTARRHGMHTDASHRFERGADWGATPLACDRVAELILESAGGKLAGYNDAVVRSLQRSPIHLDRAEIGRILGQEIPETVTARILRRLGFVPTAKRVSSTVNVSSSPAAVAEQPNAYSVAIPTWRMDVERDIDLIEEIARVYGFNNFRNTVPAFSGVVVEQPQAMAESKMRSRLLALGYDEAVSPTFISAADAQRFSEAKPVQLENPLSEETPLLRSSMLPGMLNVLEWNFNRRTDDLRLFEMGNVFAKQGNSVEQHQHLCFAATGTAGERVLEQEARDLDFFDLKGDVEAVLSLFATDSLRFEGPGSRYLHPGRSAKILLNDRFLGELGQLHPEIAAERKFNQDVWICFLNLDKLFAVPLRQPRYERLSRFPSVERDFSLLLDNSIIYARLEGAIKSLRIPELISIEPKELFRGGAVPEGKYSLLLRLTFQSSERTLGDEVAAWSRQVIAAVHTLGGTLRA
ncbi:MAG TPA: phenylalanine--tRNA ligase subunit beta [Terriglobales bacterium]|nr:phenylalanine--tRNA ligase subunit beta [Terriglobales bacterium]